MKFTPSLIDGEDNLPLKDIPISTVANIAAVLSGPDTSPHDTVRSAYHLLEIAHYGQKGLAEGTGYNAGINVHQVRELQTKMRNAQDSHIQELATYDDKGEVLPFPFDKTMKAVIRGGPKDQERKFRLYLLANYDPRIHEGRDYHYEVANAHRHIAQWKKVGIPPTVFAEVLFEFSDWWERYERERKSRTQKEVRARKKAALSKKPAPAPSPKKKRR